MKKQEKTSIGPVVILTTVQVANIIFGGVAKGESLDITLDDIDDPYFTYVQVQQTSGAKEPGKGTDSKDNLFWEVMGPRVNFYLRNVDGDFTADDREADSTSDFYARIEGVSLPGTVQMQPKFYFSELGEGNFDWKNFVIELYDNGVIGGTANKIGTYDGQDLAEGSVSFPTLTIQNGLCYQLKIKPRHSADIDLNQKIDFRDFAGLALYWLDSTAAGPSNNWNNLTDIDRDTFTDFNDLSFITYDWLWEQDPNLMSKLMAPGLEGKYLGACRRTPWAQSLNKTA